MFGKGQPNSDAGAWDRLYGGDVRASRTSRFRSRFRNPRVSTLNTQRGWRGAILRVLMRFPSPVLSLFTTGGSINTIPGEVIIGCVFNKLQHFNRKECQVQLHSVLRLLVAQLQHPCPMISWCFNCFVLAWKPTKLFFFSIILSSF